MKFDEGWQIFWAGSILFVLATTTTIWTALFTKDKYKEAKITAIVGLILAAIMFVTFSVMFHWISLPNLISPSPAYHARPTILPEKLLVDVVRYSSYFINNTEWVKFVPITASIIVTVITILLEFIFYKMGQNRASRRIRFN